MDFSSAEELRSSSPRGASGLNRVFESVATDNSIERTVPPAQPVENTAWRGELAQRLEAYRKRRRKVTPNAAQSHFSFEEASIEVQAPPAFAVAETPSLE